MTKKHLILTFMFSMAILFTISIVYFSKFSLSEIDREQMAYFKDKQMEISGSILSKEKIAGTVHLFEVDPTVFKNTKIETANTIGFYLADTTACYILAPYPDGEPMFDSLAIKNKTAYFYDRGTEIASKRLQLLRWNTMQRVKDELETNKSIKLLLLN